MPHHIGVESQIGGKLCITTIRFRKFASESV